MIVKTTHPGFRQTKASPLIRRSYPVKISYPFWITKICPGFLIMPAPNRLGHKAMLLSDVYLTVTSDVCLSRTSGLSQEKRGLGRPKLAQR